MRPTNPQGSDPDVPSLVERYFSAYLLNQRNLSPETTWSYRDTFRLFFEVSQRRFRQSPASLTLADFDAPRVLAFLDYLETQRHNCVRSRNVRLAALRSFLRYAALQCPTALAPIYRALAVPVKRFNRVPVSYLSRDGVLALVSAPDLATWSGHRDRVMLTTMYNTGARVSEIIGLNSEDWRPGPVSTPRIRGKGRKERVVPLWKNCGRTPRSSSAVGCVEATRHLASRSFRIARVGASPGLGSAHASMRLWSPHAGAARPSRHAACPPIWYGIRRPCTFYSRAWTSR